MKTYDVILVTDTPGWTYFYGKRVWERGFGAHRLATHLRENGYSVLVIDFSSYITFDRWSKICQHAVGSNTKFIGFSTTWWPARILDQNYDKRKLITSFNHSPKANELLYSYGETLTIAAGTGKLGDWINVAKNINSKIKIGLGGPKIANYFDVPADHFFVGFGETQLLDFLSQPRRIWPKIIEHDTEAKSGDFNFIHSNTTYEEESFIQPYETFGIEFSRGCRFKCSFCRYPLIGRKDVASYVKPSEHMYNELLENYERWGITRYNILDDTLNDSTEKLESIVSAVKRLPFKPIFWCYSRADMIYAHPEQITLLKEMGLVSTTMGIETFHPEAAKIIGKGMGAEKRKDILYRCKEEWGDSVTITTGYIVGLPGEPLEHIEGVAQWLATPDCPVYYMPFAPLSLFHNSELTKYNQKSMMDLNPEKYGYKVSPGDGIGAVWTKDDGTGISNFQQATEIAQRLNAQQIANKKISKILPNSMYDPGSMQNPDWYFDKLINYLCQNNTPDNVISSISELSDAL